MSLDFQYQSNRMKNNILELFPLYPKHEEKTLLFLLWPMPIDFQFHKHRIKRKILGLTLSRFGPWTLKIVKVSKSDV